MKASAKRARPAFDPFRPQSFLIELERSESGAVVSVATLFLTNRECPWRCLYCDLWKNTLTETVPPGAIPAQIDFALEQLGNDDFWRDELRESHSESQSGKSGTRVARPSRTRPSRITQIKLYNSGNFFDPRAIPPEDFPAIAARLAGFERVIVECHPALVGESAVKFRGLLSPSLTAKLEVAMGLEIADDALLARLNKRMTLEMFARAARFLREHDMAVRVFIIVRPPFVRTEEEALAFARRSIDFAFDCGATAVSLIPARFGAAELQPLAESGDFAPPRLETLEAALDYGISLGHGRVFADLWDLEKLSACQDCFALRRERLEQINFQQRSLPAVACSCCSKHQTVVSPVPF